MFKTTLKVPDSTCVYAVDPINLHISIVVTASYIMIRKPYLHVYTGRALTFTAIYPCTVR